MAISEQALVNDVIHQSRFPRTGNATEANEALERDLDVDVS